MIERPSCGFDSVCPLVFANDRAEFFARGDGIALKESSARVAVDGIRCAQFAPLSHGIDFVERSRRLDEGEFGRANVNVIRDSVERPCYGRGPNVAAEARAAMERLRGSDMQRDAGALF